MRAYHLLDPRAVLDVADRAYERHRGMRPANFLLDAVQREFVQLEEHERARLEARDLAAQLAADRAARAGDHDRRGR